MYRNLLNQVPLGDKEDEELKPKRITEVMPIEPPPRREYNQGLVARIMMYRNLLNQVPLGDKEDEELKPKPTKKYEYKYEPEPPSGYGQVLVARIIQLIFTLFIIAILWFGGKYGVECFVSFCKGKPHMSWEEITNSYSSYKEQNR